MRRRVHTAETLRMQVKLNKDFTNTAPEHTADGLKAYDVIGISGDHWQVHKHGCSATFSKLGQILTADLVWAANVDDVPPQVIDSELLDMGYDYGCVVYHNCTKKY